MTNPHFLIPTPSSSFSANVIRRLDTLVDLFATPTYVLVPVQQCKHCDSWLSPNDRYCADCGRASTHRDASWRSDLLKKYAKFGAAAGAGIVIALLCANSWSHAVWALVYGPLLVLSCTLAALAGAEALNSRTLARARASDCLRSQERFVSSAVRLIDNRLVRLHRAHANVDVVMTTSDRDTCLAVVTDKIRARNTERDGYQIRLWCVEFARWVNALRPITTNMDHTSFEETARRLVRSTSAVATATLMRSSWLEQPAAATIAGNNCVARLDKALRGLQIIREGLVLRQAVVADPDSTYITYPSSPSPALEAAVRKFDQLFVDITAGRFSGAFAEIDAEHNRLLAEAEVEATVIVEWGFDGRNHGTVDPGRSNFDYHED